MQHLKMTLLLICTMASLAAAQQTHVQAIELPMRLVNGMPAVEVFVNGQGPFVFRIDTGGAGQARVDAAVVKQLNLPQVGEARGGDGGGGSVAMAVVKLDSLKLGSLEFKNVEALSRDYNRTGGERVDGILCFGLFTDCLFTLDYPARKVILGRGALVEADGRRIFPFTQTNGIPSIKLDLAGTQIEAHIDSGNVAAGFMLAQEHAAKLEMSGEPVTVGRARTVNREFEIKEATLAGEIRLGAYRFPSPVIRFAEVFPHANLGVAVLREFALTFDQKNRRVRWERWGEVVTLAAPPPPTNSGAALSTAEAQSLVGVYGARTISLVDGKLMLQRAGGPQLTMLKLSADEFGLAEVPEARVKFGRDAAGKVTELRVRNPQGEWETSIRTN